MTKKKWLFWISAIFMTLIVIGGTSLFAYRLGLRNGITALKNNMLPGRMFLDERAASAPGMMNPQLGSNDPRLSDQGGDDIPQYPQNRMGDQPGPQPRSWNKGGPLMQPRSFYDMHAGRGIRMVGHFRSPLAIVLSGIALIIGVLVIYFLIRLIFGKNGWRISFQKKTEQPALINELAKKK
jgi:hypothetical protein